MKKAIFLMLTLGFNIGYAMETTVLNEQIAIITENLKVAVIAGDRANVNEIIQEANQLSLKAVKEQTLKPDIMWGKPGALAHEVNKAFNIIRSFWANAHDKQKVERIWVEKKRGLNLIILAKAIETHNYALVKEYIEDAPLLIYPLDYFDEQENKDLCKAALLTSDRNIQRSLFKHIVNDPKMDINARITHCGKLLQMLVSANCLNAVETFSESFSSDFLSFKKNLFNSEYLLELARNNPSMTQFIKTQIEPTSSTYSRQKKETKAEVAS